MIGTQEQISSASHLRGREALPQPSLGVCSFPQASTKSSGWESAHARDFIIINNSLCLRAPFLPKSGKKDLGQGSNGGNCRGEPGSQWESTYPQEFWFCILWVHGGTGGVQAAAACALSWKGVMVISGWVILTLTPCCPAHSLTQPSPWATPQPWVADWRPLGNLAVTSLQSTLPAYSLALQDQWKAL